ncbi:hypothetical protein [Pseudonocardia sp. T1-2H]|uniref:hypothetical protein n=1 Tax=Pseudonocardia sp. T1-2H TaxID=3128899 RepID=UPI0031010BCC
MQTAVRLGSYLAVLCVVFGAAWGAGSAFGGSGDGPAPAAAQAHEPGMAAMAPPPAAAGPDPADPLGLSATAAGYTFVPTTTSFGVNSPTTFSFRITGSDGAPVTAFDAAPDQEFRPGERMNLLVVRRDAAGMQDLSPTMGPDGTWNVPFLLPAAGVWRAYADFIPTGGPRLALGTDLFAPGEFAPFTFPDSRIFPPAGAPAAVDGYQVRIDGRLVPGVPSAVYTTVGRWGQPVTELEPTRGGFGRLVAVREGDLAYVRVRPETTRPLPTDRAGPAIAFSTEVPTAGTYRFFLGYRHEGRTGTAEFTVSTAGS